MDKKFPVFDIDIDLFDMETGMGAVSLVEYPAIERDFLMFNDDKKAFQFADDDRHIVTGAAMIAGKEIYRYNPDTGYEYFVRFSKETIEKLVLKYMKENRQNSVNLEHSPLTFVDGAIMIESYIIDNERGICPKEFEGLSDGSWIVSYKITDNELWQEIKSGRFKGFSIEGIFNLVETKMSRDEKDEISLILYEYGITDDDLK